MFRMLGVSPAPRPRRVFPLVVAALVVLALGAAAAYGVNGALGLSFTPVVAAQEHSTAAPMRADVAPPDIARIVVPNELRLTKAAAAVANALADRGRPRPAIGQTTDAGQKALTVRIAALSGHQPEAYRITEDLRIEAAGAAGAAAGLYAIADRIRSGAALPIGEVVEPRLGLRLTDVGSVGREADPAAFAQGTDYSLNTDVVGSALLPQAPWVDPAAVDRIGAQFRQFVDHSAAQGYNGVVVPGFLEYVTFANAEGVYPAGDVHVARAEAMVKAFGPVFAYAHSLGLKVFFLTDMLAVSPPLEKYLDGKSTQDPALWAVYQKGLAELFDSMPADGLMVRIGEGGDVYRQAGWDYSSKIAVTTPAAVRAMLTAFLHTAGERNKDIIFRTWTVGVGAVGDLHTNPDSYKEVLGGLNDPHLVVSTKYAAGDFYSHLPLNPTLDIGDQRRIVEFQARREFEGFGALPNDLGSLEQLALQHFLASNPHIEGVWNWTQDGGPLRAGPMSLYLKSGFWPLYDLNTYATSRLAWDPRTDPAQITADWARQTFSDDPKTVAAIGEVMALSRAAVTQGLYIGAYADNSVQALGLEPPPMMWIFEWDIVTGDSAALDSIRSIVDGHTREAVAEGENAVALARRMQAAIAATDPATWRDPELYQRFAATMAYEVNLLDTLSAYREMVLTGAGEGRYRAARAAHMRAYVGDLDLPAYNFTAADLGMVRADRDAAMAWLARILLGLILIVLAIRPRLLRPAGRLDRFLALALPVFALVASRAILTRFAAPAHLIITLGGWALFVVAARLLLGRRDPIPLYATIGAVALARTVVLLGALSVHGPGGYWYAFWTDPIRRSLYITVSFACFAWLFVAVFRVLRAQGALRRQSSGVVLAAAGTALAIPAVLVTALGLERALTIWNDQMALLPWGLSRILGITVYLGIPAYLPGVAVGIGAALAAVGILLTGQRFRSRTKNSLS